MRFAMVVPINPTFVLAVFMDRLCFLSAGFHNQGAKYLFTFHYTVSVMLYS